MPQSTTSIPFLGPHGMRGQVLTRGHGPVFEPDEKVTVQLDDGRTLQVPFSLLHRDDEDGIYRLDMERGGTIEPSDGGVRIPVVAEHVEVEKRVRDTGGVRIRRDVHEQEVTIDEPLFKDEVHVERRKIGKVVDARPQSYSDGDVTVIPVVEEVLVLSRRYLIKEEVRVQKRRVEHHQPQDITLRREEVVVERLPPALDDNKHNGG